jgi:hypothetical protein
MAGLVLLSCWIIFREQRLAISIPLVFILLYWGNIVAATYAYSALHRADGDWERFFLGERKPGERPQQTAAVPVSRLKRALFYVGALACAAYAAWGMRRADFARYTVIGYLWGFVPIVAALLVAAHRKKTVNPT